jgi:hypothetical protein
MKPHSLNQFGFRHDQPDVIFKVLNALGLHSGTGTPEEQVARLQAAGQGFSVSAVDDALAEKTDFNLVDRMAFKLALSHKGLLKGVRVP